MNKHVQEELEENLSGKKGNNYSIYEVESTNLIFKQR
jgi:hypothetical protein